MKKIIVEQARGCWSCPLQVTYPYDETFCAANEDIPVDHVNRPKECPLLVSDILVSLGGINEAKKKSSGS